MGIFQRVTHRVKQEVIENPYAVSKIEPSKIDKVIAYGCSFTAGDEIVDHLLLDMTFEEVNEVKKNFNNQVEFYKNYKINFPHPLMLENSWAGQFAKLIEKPIENFAKPGASLGESYFNLYCDYKNNKIGPNDLVVIGLTAPSRILYFNQELTKFESAPILNYMENKKLSYPAKKAVLDLNDENMFVFNYFNILHCINVLKHFINIRIQPMSSSNTIHHHDFVFKNCDSEIRKYANLVWDDISDIIFLKDTYLLTARETSEINLCGYLHPPLENHIRLAQAICDKCVIK